MKLEYLKEFVVLAESLNYSVAARQLYITQPALSRHIAYIEEEFGTKLFLRDTHNVVLTEAGQECLQQVRDIVSRYDQLLLQMEKRRRV